MGRERKQPDFRTQWGARVGKARRFMRLHAAEPLTLGQVARHAGASPYHFGRMFAALTGETPFAYVTRARLAQAAALLQEPATAVTEVALQVGYETPSAFNKSFKAWLGVTPTHMRRMNAEQHAALLALLKDPERRDNMLLDISKEPAIRERTEVPFIYVRRLGRVEEEAPNAWAELHRLIWPAKLVPPDCQFIGACWDNGSQVEESRLRYDAGVVVPRLPEKLPAGLLGGVFPGGRFAAFRYRGTYKYIAAAFEQICAGWVARSGVALRQGPWPEIYLNRPGEVPEEDLLTELLVPIA
ncbi:MAG TPA: AraC family transcriptional regulator [bacterium]|nr:AraC family transcriptional regulator [bacterium]